MLNQPVLKPVPEKNEYVLIEDYYFEYNNIEYVIPAEFLFDGASIPWFGWLSTYTPFHPDVMAAAIAHDYVYANQLMLKTDADQMLYHRLIENKANKYKAMLMFLALLIGTGSTYK